MGQTVVAGFSTHPDWDHGVVMQAQPTVRHEDYWPALSELQQKITARLEEKGVSVAVPPEIPIRIEEGATRPSPPGSGGTPPSS